MIVRIALYAFALTLFGNYCVRGFSVTKNYGRVLPSLSRRNNVQKSSSLLSSTGGDDDDDFMASLRSRLEEVNDRETKLPLVVLDSMLPRQVLKIQVENPLFMELVRDRIQKESPYFGMTGMARLRSGQQVHLKSGVEVEIVDKPEFDESSNKDGLRAMRIVLKAGRRFRIDGNVENAKEGWTEARIKYLNANDEQEEEVTGSEDRMSVARAMIKAREFTTPNMNMKDNMTLIDRWVQLAKENERQPGQIDTLLEQLGDIPSSDEPTERAFWVGALINPIPAMGVAMEVRPALLSAKTTEERVQVALDGILSSIKHMDGSARMW